MKKCILVILIAPLTLGCEVFFYDMVWEDWQVISSREVYSYEGAVFYCENLGLAGHDRWRLPTVGEMRSLIRGCPNNESAGPCTLGGQCLSSSCDDNCDGCPENQGPNSGCYWPSVMNNSGRDCGMYWSSSVIEDRSTHWVIDFSTGDFKTTVADASQIGVKCIME